VFSEAKDYESGGDNWSYKTGKAAVTQIITANKSTSSCCWKIVFVLTLHVWTAFSDYTRPDLLCSTVFHFWLIFFLFILGRAVD